MKMNVNTVKSSGITGKQSSSDCDDVQLHTLCSEVTGMDIDCSALPSSPIPQPSVQSAKPPSLPTASTVKDPNAAWSAFTPKKVGFFTSSVPVPDSTTPLNDKYCSDTDSDDMDLSSSSVPMGENKEYFRTTKESCAPMTAMKADNTSIKFAAEPFNGHLPTESSERMNELANRYREQGSDH